MAAAGVSKIRFAPKKASPTDSQKGRYIERLGIGSNLASLRASAPAGKGEMK